MRSRAVFMMMRPCKFLPRLKTPPPQLQDASSPRARPALLFCYESDSDRAGLVKVITGSTFDGALFEGANFEDALVGSEDSKRLCSNPTVVGVSREQLGCRN